MSILSIFHSIDMSINVIHSVQSQQRCYRDIDPQGMLSWVRVHVQMGGHPRC